MTRLHVHSSFGSPPPPWFKGRGGDSLREVASVTAWCWHQTDVAGGFGAADLEARCVRYAGTSESQAGVPYHYVYSPQDDALVALWHPSLYSYHGNGANAWSIGIAIDGSYPGDELDVGALAEAWSLAIEHAAGLDWSPDELDAHRQHSDARGGDPGEDVWPTLEIIALEYEITPTITRVTGNGQTIPDSWRPDSDGGGGTVGRPAVMPIVSAWAATSGDVRTLQALLEARGHSPRGIDGVWGANSDAAFASFKVARRLAPGSIVTGDTWHELLTPDP